MIRGTTAQWKFTLPYKYSDIELVKVVFWQPNNNGPSSNRPLPIFKGLEQCGQCENENEISVTLHPEETLRFSDDRKAYVQLSAKSVDGIRFATKQESINVYPIYDDSVIEDIITPTPDYNGWIVLDGQTIE